MSEDRSQSSIQTSVSDKTLSPSFSGSDVEMISKDVLYDGFFKFYLYRFRHALFAGGVSKEITREILERGHAVVLIPYDPIRDEVVLIEQIRIAAIETSASPWLFEMVAGMIEPNEAYEEVARREAEEEAGVTVKRIEPALSYLASPGGTTERLHILAGEVDSQTASGIHGLATENEDIRVHVVKREVAYQMVNEGKIDNAATVISLMWLQLNYQNLQQKWS